LSSNQGVVHQAKLVVAALVMLATGLLALVPFNVTWHTNDHAQCDAK
jgi:hypothetical protein